MGLPVIETLADAHAALTAAAEGDIDEEHFWYVEKRAKALGVAPGAITAGVRHVQTPEGADWFNQPIGSVIVDKSFLKIGKKLSNGLKAGDIISHPTKSGRKVKILSTRKTRGQDSVNFRGVDSRTGEVVAGRLPANKNVQTWEEVKGKDVKAKLPEFEAKGPEGNFMFLKNDGEESAKRPTPDDIQNSRDLYVDSVKGTLETYIDDQHDARTIMEPFEEILEGLEKDIESGKSTRQVRDSLLHDLKNARGYLNYKDIALDGLIEQLEDEDAQRKWGFDRDADEETWTVQDWNTGKAPKEHRGYKVGDHVIVQGIEVEITGFPRPGVAYVRDPTGRGWMGHESQQALDTFSPLPNKTPNDGGKAVYMAATTAYDRSRHDYPDTDYEAEYDEASKEWIVRSITTGGKGDAGHYATKEEAEAAAKAHKQGFEAWQLLGEAVRAGEIKRPADIGESDELWARVKHLMLGEHMTPSEAVDQVKESGNSGVPSELPEGWSRSNNDSAFSGHDVAYSDEDGRFAIVAPADADENFQVHELDKSGDYQRRGSDYDSWEDALNSIGDSSLDVNQEIPEGLVIDNDDGSTRLNVDMQDTLRPFVEMFDIDSKGDWMSGIPSGGFDTLREMIADGADDEIEAGSFWGERLQRLNRTVDLLENMYDIEIDPTDLIDLAEAHHDLGWAIQEQMKAILEGESLEEQNGNALDYIAQFFSRKVKRTRGLGEVEDHINMLLEGLEAFNRGITSSAILARAFSNEQREKLAKSGKALPDKSYPIENRSDLGNAIQAFGRAKNKKKAKKHIIKRARALGATDMLPSKWGVSS